jgi:hypothetical protein
MTIFFIIVTCIFILMFLPIPIKIHIGYKNKKFHILLLNTDILKKFASEKYKSNFENNKSNSNTIDKFKKILGVIDPILKINPKSKLNIDINISYGLDDAAATAILYGVLNSLIPQLFTVISNFFRLEKREVSITPDFNKTDLKVEVNCIIYISFAKLIYVIVILIIKTSRFKTGSESSKT